MDPKTEAVESVKNSLLQENKELEKDAHLIVGPFFLEVLPSGTHKAVGVQALCDELKVSNRRVARSRAEPHKTMLVLTFRRSWVAD